LQFQHLQANRYTQYEEALHRGQEAPVKRFQVIDVDRI
jgi:hypothetical protein